jgi:D-alanine-D-alanine ligase
MSQKHVAVLMGGWSAEREVSLMSGAQCSAALTRLGYQVTDLDVGRDLGSVLSKLKPDVCFNALHGLGGEDGEVQGLLEILQIPYTHSGVTASALAMDKRLTKKILAHAGVPVAIDVDLPPHGLSEHPFQVPYVVKPIRQGSSVSIVMVEDVSRPLPDALTVEGWAFEQDMMAEVFVPGRELTCAIMGKHDFEIIEITTERNFYDYTAKYNPGGSLHEIPARIPDALKGQIQDYARKAHELLGCRGVTRTDFRFDEEHEGLVVLEINTQPGMTPLSLVPEMAQASGMTFDDLINWLMEDASCQR